MTKPKAQIWLSRNWEEKTKPILQKGIHPVGKEKYQKKPMELFLAPGPSFRARLFMARPSGTQVSEGAEGR